MPSKYRNKKLDLDGLTFDSRAEGARWIELRALEAAGKISDLRRQVRIPAVVGGVQVFTYIADFVYNENGAEIIEDVKSRFTRTLPVYRLKKKVLSALGVTIKEYGT